MRPFEQRLSDLLLDVYEAAANPQHWQILLQRIATEMEATKASIHVHAFSGQSWATHTAGNRVHRVGYDESAASAYANYYAIRDPYIQHIRQRFPRDGSGQMDKLRCVHVSLHNSSSHTGFVLEREGIPPPFVVTSQNQVAEGRPKAPE